MYEILKKDGREKLQMVQFSCIRHSQVPFFYILESEESPFPIISPVGVIQKRSQWDSQAWNLYLQYSFMGICYHAGFSKPLPQNPIYGNLSSRSRHDCFIMKVNKLEAYQKMST